MWLTRRARWRGVLGLGMSAALLSTTGTGSAAPNTAPPGDQHRVAAGPYASLIFSRTEITAADDCVIDNRGIARLDSVVAPYLAARDMAATGTLTTDATRPARLGCTHERASMTASWAHATTLAQEFAWHFVSHTATYPRDLAGLTPERAAAETCGSAETLEAHGLPGARGLIAYPGAQSQPVALQTDYGSRCFVWGRGFSAGGTGITKAEAATTAPYWQHTLTTNGGPCNAAAPACSNPTGARRYLLPASIIALVNSLEPAEWLTLQSFVLVRGRSPAYSTSQIRWDCTATDPRFHWTNDWERYCYRDWQAVVRSIDARAAVTVTDPLTVGIAFGRAVPGE
jgi:hypothetical protein